MVPETASGGRSTEPAAQIVAEETGVALPGDRVSVKHSSRRARANSRANRWDGSSACSSAAATTVIGNLVRSGRRNFAVTPDDPRFVYEITWSRIYARVGHQAAAPRPGDKVTVKLGEWKQRRRAAHR